MAKRRLEKTFGTINVSRRAATFLALREKADVVFEFNDVEHTVTLEDAKLLLPTYLKDSLSQIDSIKNDFDRRLESVKERLQEDLDFLQDLWLAVV